MSPRKPAVTFLLFGYYATDPRVRRQAEALVADGWVVDVLCTSESGRGRSWRLNGVAIQEISLTKQRAGLVSYLRQYLHATVAFKRILATRASVPDIVQVATLPDFLVAAATPARKRGARIVLDFHEIMPEFFSSKYGGVLGAMARRFLERVEKWSARRADVWLTVNDAIADRFRERLGQAPYVIYNSPDENLFGSAAPSPPHRPSGRVQFGYHGTLTRIYGLDLLIDAASILRKSHQDFEVLVIGDGPELASLQKRVDRHGLRGTIRFAGRVPLEMVPQRLRDIHVGVVPTRKDDFLDLSLGTKLLEYVHVGRPVVSANLHAVQRVFPPPHSLYYFRGNDPRSLADAMRQSLEAPPEEWRERTKRAQEHYASITWERMRKRYIEVLRQVLEA